MWWGMFAGMWDVELEIAVNINLQFISFDKTVFLHFYLNDFMLQVSSLKSRQ